MNNIQTAYETEIRESLWRYRNFCKVFFSYWVQLHVQKTIFCISLIPTIIISNIQFVINTETSQNTM